MHQKIKKVALSAIKKAGDELLKRFNSYERGKEKFKSKHEIVTKADLASEKIILSEIKNNFPDHKILSEEAGSIKGKDDYLWIVDPLDGTTNFSFHHPLWAISIGVAKSTFNLTPDPSPCKGEGNYEMAFGLVYAPYLGEMYFAEAGKGAFLMNGQEIKKMKVSNIKEGKALHSFCHGSKEADIKRAIKYYTKQKLAGFDCRQLGSAALELAFVACGRLESIFIPGANAWDVSAGALLVKEAGGKVTDINGKPWSLLSKDILASNGKIHKSILNIAN